MEVEVDSVPRMSAVLGETVVGEDAGMAEDGSFSMRSYYEWRIAELEEQLRRKVQNKLRLEAQRNELNSRVRNLRDELKELMRPGFYVGEVVKVMGKNKVLVKVCKKKKKKKKKKNYNYYYYYHCMIFIFIYSSNYIFFFFNDVDPFRGKGCGRPGQVY
jgi:hypothetical protein